MKTRGIAPSILMNLQLNVYQKTTTPPVNNHPVDNPPVDEPWVEDTPVEDTPPVDTPLVDTPSVDAPPVDTPPVDTPPAVKNYRIRVTKLAGGGLLGYIADQQGPLNLPTYTTQVSGVATYQIVGPSADGGPFDLKQLVRPQIHHFICCCHCS